MRLFSTSALELLVENWYVCRLVGVDTAANRQAVGLATGPHGRRPTGAIAQRVYGVGLESGARSSPDSSGSPQQCDAIAFCTGA
ncbi:MAG: hypothetical protein RIS47_1494 [Bacteroidota bacterium]